MLYEHEITDGLRMFNAFSNRKVDEAIQLNHKRSVASVKEMGNQNNSKPNPNYFKIKIV